MWKYVFSHAGMYENIWKDVLETTHSGYHLFVGWCAGGFLSVWHKPGHIWKEEIPTEGLPPSNNRAFSGWWLTRAVPCLGRRSWVAQESRPGRPWRASLWAVFHSTVSARFLPPGSCLESLSRLSSITLWSVSWNKPFPPWVAWS